MILPDFHQPNTGYFCMNLSWFHGSMMKSRRFHLSDTFKYDGLSNHQGMQFGWWLQSRFDFPSFGNRTDQS